MADQVDEAIAKLHEAGASDEEITSLLKEKFGRTPAPAGAFDVKAQNAVMSANMARQNEGRPTAAYAGMPGGAPPKKTFSVFGVPVSMVGDRPRADSNIVGNANGEGIAPEDALMAGQAVRGVVGAARAGTGIVGKGLAAAGETVKQAAPVVKYEVTKRVLSTAGVPEPVAAVIAMAVSGRSAAKNAVAPDRPVTMPGYDRNMPNTSAGPAVRLYGPSAEGVEAAPLVERNITPPSQTPTLPPGQGPNGLPIAAQELANPASRSYMESQFQKNVPIADAIHGAKNGAASRVVAAPAEATNPLFEKFALSSDTGVGDINPDDVRFPHFSHTGAGPTDIGMGGPPPGPALDLTRPVAPKPAPGRGLAPGKSLEQQLREALAYEMNRRAPVGAAQ